MRSCGRFIEDIQRFSCPDFRELREEFDALGFSAGERRSGWNFPPTAGPLSFRKKVDGKKLSKSKRSDLAREIEIV